MRCAWRSFIDLLPPWMRDFVDKQGRDALQELRLRVNAPPLLKLKDKTIAMSRSVTSEDLIFCVNLVTKYSPWSVSTASKCYFTAPGGHRVGLCGVVAVSNGQAIGVRNVTSLCIRIARDFPGIAKEISNISGSVLILGKPGSGKTTLLRDYIRLLSTNHNDSVTVVDERQEIFPYFGGTFCFETGLNTDVISGCDKAMGIEAALRNTGPSIIAVDEITAADDCTALLRAGWCGVDLIATAHAGSRKDLFTRPVYRPIVESNLFDHLLIMHPDKSWHIERMIQ